MHYNTKTLILLKNWTDNFLKYFTILFDQKHQSKLILGYKGITIQSKITFYLNRYKYSFYLCFDAGYCILGTNFFFSSSKETIQASGGWRFETQNHFVDMYIHIGQQLHTEPCIIQVTSFANNSAIGDAGNHKYRILENAENPRHYAIYSKLLTVHNSTSTGHHV